MTELLTIQLLLIKVLPKLSTLINHLLIIQLLINTYRRLNRPLSSHKINRIAPSTKHKSRKILLHNFLKNPSPSLEGQIKPSQGISLKTISPSLEHNGLGIEHLQNPLKNNTKNILIILIYNALSKGNVDTIGIILMLETVYLT